MGEIKRIRTSTAAWLTAPLWLRVADRPAPSFLLSPPSNHSDAATAVLGELAALGVADISVQTSVSLQHLPYDLSAEPAAALAPELQSKLAFAVQKLDALAALAKQVWLVVCFAVWLL